MNEALYEWFRMTCAKNIYPSGPQLIAKAKEIATRLGIDGFEGSMAGSQNGREGTT